MSWATKLILEYMLKIQKRIVYPNVESGTRCTKLVRVCDTKNWTDFQGSSKRFEMLYLKINHNMDMKILVICTTLHKSEGNFNQQVV